MAKGNDAVRQMFADVSLGAPENAVGFVMWRVVARFQREMDRVLLPDDLTHLQFTTLALIAWFGRDGVPLTQVALARQAGIHPMQVSQTVKVLHTKGMVHRRPGLEDAREKRLEITPAGLKTLRAAIPKAIAVQEKLFGAEGKPGGSLLTMLLAIEQDAGEAGR